MTKMNSIDKAVRNERDIKELLNIADKATSALVEAVGEIYGDRVWASDLRNQFEAIIDRRQLEDEGRATV